MIRLILRVTAIAALLLLCVPLHYLWRLFGLPSPWPSRFLGGVGRIAGIRVTVSGAPLASHVLFVANHLSWLDIMLVGGAGRAAFVSRDDVGRWPVIGWMARLNRTVFVDRSERRAVRDQADALRTALADGRPVALFPEGTTDGGTEILPFRPSLLSSLFPPLPGVMLQPIAVDYGPAAPEIAWTGAQGAVENARRVLSRPGTVQVTMRFLPPVDPAELGDRKALAHWARRQILEALAANPHPSAAIADRL